MKLKMSSYLLIRFCVFLVLVNPIFSKYVRMTAANEPGQYKKGLKFRGDQAYVADNEIGFDAEPAADGFFEFKFNSDCREDVKFVIGNLLFTVYEERLREVTGEKFITVSTKTGNISGSVFVGEQPRALSMDEGHVLVKIKPLSCTVDLIGGYPVVNDALLGLIGGLTVVQLSLAIALPIIGTAAIILAIIYTIKKLKGYKLKKDKDQESKKNVDKKKKDKHVKEAKKQEKETKQKSKKKLKKANPPQIDFGVLTEKKEKSKRVSGADETVDQAPSKQKSVVIPSLVMKTASIDKKFEEKEEEVKLDPQVVDSPVAGAQAEKKVEKAGKPSKKSKKRGKKAQKKLRTVSSGQDEDLKVIDDQWDTDLAKKKGATTKTRTLTDGKEDDMVVLDDDYEGDMAKKAAAAAKKKKSRTPTDPSCCAPEDDMAVLDEDWRTAKKKRASRNTTAATLTKKGSRTKTETSCGAPEDDMAVLDEDWRTAKKRKVSAVTKTTTKDPSQEPTGTVMGQTLSATLPDNSEERQKWRKEREKAARYRASQDSQEPVIAKRANKKEP